MTLAPPEFARDIKEQSVEKGEQLKLKIPFNGSGPVEFVLKKNGKPVPTNDRVKIVPYDNYVVLQIKGKEYIVIHSLLSNPTSKSRKFKLISLIGKQNQLISKVLLEVTYKMFLSNSKLKLTIIWSNLNILA